MTFGTNPHYLVIDRDWFSPSEWNISKLIDIPYKSRRKYLNVTRECHKKIANEKLCSETKFEETFEIEQPDPYTKEIDLQFDVVQYVEGSPSSSEMALDLLSLQSIFFGFTLLQLFWLVYRFTKPRWRLKNRTDKIVWFLVCLLCSIGCSLNTIRIDDMIINGELLPTQYYEMAERIQMPAMVFCLRIDQKIIDRNHPLTGRYLESLTRKINVRSIFFNIAYLNESNQWTTFDLRRVERFFLFNMKCFRVDIDLGYDRNQFHFSDDTQVLKIDFNWMEWNGFDRLVHFMTRSKETKEFSKIVYLHYVQKLDNNNYGYGYGLNNRFQITHESSLYELKDRFSFFRRQFPSLEEGDMGDLHGQLLELQANNPKQTMLNLPLEEEHFGIEVDEDRFEQLYSVQKKKSGNRRTNLNYQKIFIANHLRKFDSDFEPDFTFHLVFLRRVVYYTNEVSYATLTLSLINLLSIWLELSVLDLRPYLVRFHECFLIYLYLHLPLLLLRKFIKALIFCCRWLRKFEPALYELIDSQWKEEEEEEAEDSADDSSEIDESSDSSRTCSFILVFLYRTCFKLFNLLKT